MTQAKKVSGDLQLLIVLAVSLAILGLVLSYSVFEVVVDTHEARLETDMWLEVNGQLGSLEQGLSRSAERLGSVSAFYRSSGSVSARAFRNFTALYLRQDEGFVLLGWAPIEAREDISAEASGQPSAAIRLPLLRIEPGPLEWLGFGDDLLTIDGMADAVDRSFIRGDVQYLLAGDEMILVKPTLDEADWSGLAIAVLPINALESWIAGSGSGVSIHISEEQTGKVIVQHGAPVDGRSLDSTMSFGGEIWRVSATSAGPDEIPATAWATLVAGIVMTALLLVLITTLADSARRAEKIVGLRTRELRQAEAEARSQAVRLANEVTLTNQVISAIPSILIGVGTDRRISQWNRAIQEISGVSRKEASGKVITECGWAGDTASLSAGVDQCLASSGPVRLDNLQFTGADDADLTVGMTIMPIRDSEDRLDGCLIIGADITERNKMEVQLRESQRLEAVGRLAAGIAHEVNTPAQFVSDNTTFLKEAFDDLIALEKTYTELLAADGMLNDEQRDRLSHAQQAADRDFLIEEVPQALEQSLDGIRRIADIVRAMKEFSHPGGGGQKEQVDFNRMITNAITVAANEWKYHAEIETELDESLPPVSCFPRELNQVVLNLLINAAHAIADSNGDSGERGTIRITTSHGGGVVQMRLTDSGTGIPEHVRDKIFEPFFTTKDVGRGSGQGLALAYSAVVEKHEGELVFETEMGIGTTFIVSLPLQEHKSQTEVIA